MPTITINNSYSNISGLTAYQEKELRNALSYVIGGSSAYFSGYGPKRKSLLDKKGMFPTGLLSRVYKCLNRELKVVPLTVDNRKQPPQLRSQYCGLVKPYPDQINALTAALVCKQGIITMPTGSGKSLVIALIAARLNVKTLVVVPSLEIKQQLKASLLNALGPKHKVTVENIDSKKLKTAIGFDCLIIDEAHHSASKTYQKLNKTTWTGIFYRFFLTATPFRNDTEETLLFESIAGSVIYQLSYKDAVKAGYIVPVEAYYLEVPKQNTDAYSWAQVYSELVVNNYTRNAIIADFIDILNEGGKSTLCLVKEIKHGEILAEMTGLPFVNGADDDSRQHIELFNKGDIKVLIGTTGILGEGIDTKPCEYVVIAGLGKAKSQFMQQVGRAVRTYSGKESAKVILIKDRSHKFCTRHFNAQSATLKEEYNSTPTKLEIK